MIKYLLLIIGLFASLTYAGARVEYQWDAPALGWTDGHRVRVYCAPGDGLDKPELGSTSPSIFRQTHPFYMGKIQVSLGNSVVFDSDAIGAVPGDTFYCFSNAELNGEFSADTVNTTGVLPTPSASIPMPQNPRLIIG